MDTTHSQDEVLVAVIACSAAGRQATVERLAQLLTSESSEVEDNLEALVRCGSLYKLVGGADWPPGYGTSSTWYLPKAASGSKRNG